MTVFIKDDAGNKITDDAGNFLIIPGQNVVGSDDIDLPVNCILAGEVVVLRSGRTVEYRPPNVTIRRVPL